MVEESQYCPWCGAVMRPKALFCHNCGHSLTGFEDAPVIGSETQDLQAEAIRADGETVITGKPTIVRTANIESANGSSATVAGGVEVNGNAAVDKPATPKKVRKTKRYVSRTEYVWEESNAPTWSVLLFSGLAFILVLLLLWLANFWK